MDSRKYQGPVKTPAEIIQILPEVERKKAFAFINLGDELNCKAQTRYAHSNKYWRCVFSKKKPLRVLFTVECTEEWWRVKAMLSNMEQLKDVCNHCSDRLIDCIKTACDCHQCSDYCKGPKPFTLGQVEYKKCIGCSFYFSDLDDSDQKSLIGLIKEDAKW